MVSFSPLSFVKKASGQIIQIGCRDVEIEFGAWVDDTRSLSAFSRQGHRKPLALGPVFVTADRRFELKIGPGSPHGTAVFSFLGCALLCHFCAMLTDMPQTPIAHSSWSCWLHSHLHSPPLSYLDLSMHRQVIWESQISHVHRLLLVPCHLEALDRIPNNDTEIVLIINCLDLLSMA